MTALYLYDDARARCFEPLALTRPLAEVRAGAELIRRRWQRALAAQPAALIAAPHLARFEEFDAPSAAAGIVPAGAIIANTRCAPALGVAVRDADVWRCEGRIAAVRLREGVSVDSLADGAAALDALVTTPSVETTIEGWWLDEVWDLIRHLPQMLVSDIEAMASRVDRRLMKESIILGTHEVIVERGAEVEPLVVFDVSAGPVLVRRGAHVSAFSRLVGPCAIGEETLVAGGRIAASSIGDHCKVHGELSNTIFIGHSNKSHDGFVGHSVLGRWVNLGAATVTSNLKNTYGTVALWTPGGQRDTGMQFLGTLFGDHAKTGIGTRLTTGSVVGAGANVFGDGTTPKVVPPFVWGIGPGSGEYALDRFLAVTERVMSRRGVALAERQRHTLAAAHAARWSAGA